MVAERDGAGEGPRDSEGGVGPVELQTDRVDAPGTDDLDGPALPPKPEPRPATTADGHAVAPDPSPGDVVGGYTLGRLLGKGGAGSVFEATGPDGAVVAMKVLAASKVKRARVVQRFFDEVRAASLVTHEGLIQILGFIEEEAPRRLAYVMELVEGEMLRSALRRETALDLRFAIQVGVQICDALTALHEGGIVHRDLKPENILVRHDEEGAPPRVKLLDFGVVKFLPVDRTQGLTPEESKPGTFVGTPRYMAPEQAAGAPVDARADLFSVGVILFEMITGRCPHEGDSLRDVVLAKLKGAPRITMNAEKEILPQELTDVVDACLQLKPSLRPEDARKVANGLRDAEMVLFTVGSMRAGDDGIPVRTPTVVPRDAIRPNAEAPEASPPAGAVGAGGRPSEVSVGPATGRAGHVSITPSRRPGPTPSRPSPEPATAPSEDGEPSRRLVLVLLGLVLVAAALMIALVAKRLTQPEEAELVTPLDEPAPTEVRYERGKSD